MTLSPRKECLNTSGNGGDVGKGVLTFVLTLPFLAPSILSKCFFASVKRLRQGSNLHLQFRKPSFYPLNYGDFTQRRSVTAGIRALNL